jgi:hypothetical protein
LKEKQTNFYLAGHHYALHDYFIFIVVGLLKKYRFAAIDIWIVQSRVSNFGGRLGWEI